MLICRSYTTSFCDDAALLSVQKAKDTCTFLEPLSWTSDRERQTPGRRQDHPPALTRGEDRRLFVTPECSSFKEVEGQINSLQDELDEIRDRARRAFQVA